MLIPIITVFIPIISILALIVVASIYIPIRRNNKYYKEYYKK